MANLNKTQETPLIPFVLTMVSVWIGTLLVVILIKSNFPSAFRGNIHPVEYLIYLVILLLPVLTTGIRTVCAGMGRLRQILIVLMLGGMMLGQVLGQSGVTYPFQPWTMFTRQQQNSVFVEYQALFEDNEWRALPFSRVLPAASRAILGQIEGRPIEYGRQIPERWEFPRAIQHLTLIHNQRYPADPILAVRVYVTRFEVTNSRGQPPIERELVLEYELGADE